MLVTRGSPAATRSSSILPRLVGHQHDRGRAGSRRLGRSSSAGGTPSAPGAKSSETRIGSCEIERNSASVPCATSTPAVHDQDMLGAILELVERVRGDQDGGAVVAQFVEDFVEGLAQRRVRGRWSVRPAAARAAAPAAPAPGPAAAACPWNRSRPCDRRRPSGRRGRAAAMPRPA